MTSTVVSEPVPPGLEEIRRGCERVCDAGGTTDGVVVAEERGRSTVDVASCHCCCCGSGGGGGWCVGGGVVAVVHLDQCRLVLLRSGH